MESVGHVDDLCSLLPGFLCRQASHDPAHGRVAEDHVIMLLRQQLLELPVRLNIIQALWRTGERRLNELFAVLELQAVLDCQIVMGSHVDLPTLLLQVPHVGEVKLADMG